MDEGKFRRYSEPSSGQILLLSARPAPDMRAHTAPRTNAATPRRSAVCRPCRADRPTTRTQRAAPLRRSRDALSRFAPHRAPRPGPSDPMIQGKTAIHGMVARGFALPGFHVTWRPQFAAVSASADHGYTRGTDEFTLPNKNDGTTTLPGRYRTGWRRGTDGVEAAPRRCRRQERNSLSISE